MPNRMILTREEAYARRDGNPQGRWPAIAAEFSGDVWPQFESGFTFQAGATVFTMGSCFARNIEKHLAALGCRVPMLDFALPGDEWHAQAPGALNKFILPTFRQALEWTAAIRARDGRVGWSDCGPIAFETADGLFIDLDMAPTVPVTRARFIERRQQIYDIQVQAFCADAVMLTPGLIEAWRDRRTGLYIQGILKQGLWLSGDRFEFELLDFDACRTALFASIDIIRAHNPSARILLTTSPVPVSATFTGMDVRVANMQSKSTLRAVCGEAALAKGVDYFPSYESAVLSEPSGVWSPDRIHVTDIFVGKIVGRLVERYMVGADPGTSAMQQAYGALLSGQARKAVRHARRALAVRPDHFEAALVLADALTVKRRYAAAAAVLNRLAAGHPDKSEVLMRLVRIGPRTKDGAAEARSLLLDRLLACEDLSISDLRVLGHLAPSRLDGIGMRAVELYPLSVPAHELLIRALTARGDVAGANAQMRRAAGLLYAPEAWARLDVEPAATD